MFLYNDNNINIYFGDNSDKIFMNDASYTTFQNSSSLLILNQFAHLTEITTITALQFSRQVHGTYGFVIDAQTMHTLQPFSIQSDYLITDLPKLGIGILTADCLPVLLHDTKNNIVAAIHAGWRGSVAGIVIKALEHMAQAFKTDPTNVRVFFGPAACQCCYKVGQDIIQAVKPYAEYVLKKQNNDIYFDLPRYNRILLEHAGIPPHAFHSEYIQCTICNHHFWSYRRQQKKAGRQMTVICIK